MSLPPFKAMVRLVLSWVAVLAAVKAAAAAADWAQEDSWTRHLR